MCKQIYKSSQTVVNYFMPKLYLTSARYCISTVIFVRAQYIIVFNQINLKKQLWSMFWNLQFGNKAFQNAWYLMWWISHVEYAYFEIIHLWNFVVKEFNPNSQVHSKETRLFTMPYFGTHCFQMGGFRNNGYICFWAIFV